MIDKHFQQTRKMLLGKDTLQKEFKELADFVKERFSVQIINVICTLEKDFYFNLELWFKYQNEADRFYKKPFTVDTQKANVIMNKFKQVTRNTYKANSVRISYCAFEPLAKEAANESITQSEILDLKEKLQCQDLWEISHCLSNVVFFLYKDEQIKQYEERGFVEIWSDMYLGLLKCYDEFGFFTKDSFRIKLDSKENFDTNFNSNHYYYYV